MNDINVTADTISNRIKEIRKRKKISQEKLAEMVLMNHRSIVRLENKQSLPTIDTLERIANALDVNITDFFKSTAPESREDLVNCINNCLDKMTDEDLKTFYKAVYHFLN